MENELRQKAFALILKRLLRIAELAPHGTPGPKQIQATAERWLEVVERKQGGIWIAGDGQRIAHAFDELEARLVHWPMPSQLLELMPPRKSGGVLPFPERTEEECQEGIEKIRAIRKKISEGMTIH